jgi:MYXO-CTERM domain-containing protein
LVRAAVVNIDFNHLPAPSTFTGVAAAPDPEGSSAVWNAIVRQAWEDTVDSGYLLDSSGNLSSIALSLGINGSHSNPAGDQERRGGLDSLMSDYAFLSSGSNQLVHQETGTLSGLVPSNSYDLYFYGQGDKFRGNVFRGQNTLFTLGGVAKQTGWDGVIGGDGVLVEGIEFVRFSAVADLDGKISFTWANVVEGPGGNVAVDLDGKSSMFAAFNAFQILDTTAAVPEPAAALLASLGLLALLQRRRAV